MGLIQTPDQLRFSYMAVLEGAKRIRGDSPQVPAASSCDPERNQRLRFITRWKRSKISEMIWVLKCLEGPNQLAPVASQNTLFPSGNQNMELPDLF